MKNAKYLLFAALGVAAVLLLTSDSANRLRNDVEEKAGEEAKKLRDRLGKLKNETDGKLNGFKSMLSHEVNGLKKDARDRMETVAEGAAKTAEKLKKPFGDHMA